MIKIENVEVMGWEHAIRGMRNPKNSWERMDSYPAVDCGKCGKIEREGMCDKKDRDCSGFECYAIGPNDHKLMKKLAKGGAVHAKYRRMITVYLDITAPLYWWKEFDTYKVGTVANSCSTMHKIHEKEFTLDDFSCENLTDGSEKNDEFLNSFIVMENGDSAYDYHLYPLDGLEIIIDLLNKNRKMFIDTKNKKYWWQMIQLLPSSYNQKRTVMLNYEVLTNMYESRKGHKLDEWRDFCKWIEKLPYSELITGTDEFAQYMNPPQ